jgi:PAS domain S-box-containing protein
MFRLLAENIPDYAVFILDPHGQVVRWSKGAERLLGFAEEEILGRRFDCFFTPEDVERGVPRMELDRALAVGRGGGDRWHVRKDGCRFWSSAVVIPLRDAAGTLQGFARILRDQTALHCERELLGTIFDKIPVMLTVYEPDTRVLRLNPAFERLIGWSSRDAAGVSLMQECYPDPAYREQVRQFMQSCRDGWMDLQMRTRDGRDVETSWANVRLSDGTQVGIGLDITDRKKYEQALRDADCRKDEFLAMLGHELRNPLAPIRSAAQVIRLLGSADPNVQRSTELIERQVQHMSRLLEDLLDVSRITRGKITLQKEPVELAAASPVRWRRRGRSSTPAGTAWLWRCRRRRCG